MIYTSYCGTPLGQVLLASDGKSLTGLWFTGQKYFPEAEIAGAEERQDLPVFQATIHWLQAYFNGKNPRAKGIPLAPAGSAFRQAVWKALLKIPYGKVSTYGALAGRLGCKSAQAIGGAVGHNPISILIPCHRVVGADGSLTGYAGGLDKKRTLLTIEGALK
jgi:methylated-DNA-[protein]-cysteine S-methyltransferase